MKIKEGVIMQGLNLRMRPCLIVANAIWRDHGQDLCVTSGLDGTHSAGSLHYYGLAVDLRTRYFSAVEKCEVAATLREKLACCYDVIVHESHIHVECDK